MQIPRHADTLDSGWGALGREMVVEAMSTATQTDASSSVIVLPDVTWQTYSLLRDSQQNRHVRMTFDQGKLFLMSPGRLHERIVELLSQMVWVWTEVHAVPRLSAGSTTMKSELLERGLEPDKCFYFQNEARVRDTDLFNATSDPPPDLAIEVDVSSLSTLRMPIYAEFGVPEVWRWIDEQIEIHRLRDKSYLRAAESVCLPGFPIDLAMEYVAKRHELDETSLLSNFRRNVS